MRILFLLVLLTGLSSHAATVPLIFDTDMGNDIDDAMALSMLHALSDRGDVKLLAVTLSKDNAHAAPYVDLYDTFYGRGSVPIGIVKDGVTKEDGKYIRPVVESRKYRRSRKSFEDAVALLRRTLAAQADQNVVIAMVGFSTNMARLLDSAPDSISPLTGRELVSKKVRLLSAMAGSFSSELAAKRYKEYNVVKDIDSAKKVFAGWPGDVVVSGFEVGIAIPYPAMSIREDLRWASQHPLRDSYELYLGSLEKDRPTWDLTSVLQAVRPSHGYFGVSPAGRIVVEDDGYTRFVETAGGRARYLTASPVQTVRVREAFTYLCTQPPAGKAAR